MTTTDLRVRLRKGNRTLTLTSGRYVLGDDFVPPAESVEPLLGAGTSANRMGGAARVGERARNRAWGFGVGVAGESEREVRQALADLGFMLGLAGDEAEPLYLELEPHTDAPAAPVWGQGAGRRYEVVHGQVAASPLWAVETARGYALPDCPVRLQIKPYALGLPQRLARATGAVFEDNLGTADGRSRGPVLVTSKTNHITNPVFGHGTWNTGWTADVGLRATRCTDPDFALFGGVSAKLVSNAEQGFYQSLTLLAQPYVISFYARRQDGAAVTVADCSAIFNSATQTPTYQAVGNGWYRVYYRGVADAAARLYGVAIRPSTALYVTGFQVENNDYPTPLVYGEMLGCAWTGTAHASTSTSAAGVLSLAIGDDTFQLGHGCVRMVYRHYHASTSGPTVRALLDARDGISASFHAYFNGTSLVFTDGANTATAASLAWSAGEVWVLHFVWGASGLAIYRNGVSLATAASFTVPAAAALNARLYLGCDNAGGSQAFGPLMDCTIWPVQLSAAEVAADAANVAPVAADGQRVGAIPWLWTKDGDDQVDNYHDSTHNNWCVIDGIPGSAPARTKLKLTGSAVMSGSFWLGRWDTDHFINPGSTLHSDNNTATSVNTTAVSLGSIALPGDFRYRQMQGREWNLFACLIDAGSNLTLAQAYQVITGGVAAVVTDYRAVSPDAAVYRTFLQPSVVLPRIKDLYTDSDPALLVNLGARAVRTAAGAANVTLTWLQLMPRPLTRLFFPNSTSEKRAYVADRSAHVCYTLTDGVEEQAYVYGDTFELVPDKRNQVSFLQGYQAYSWLSTYTLDFSVVTITPRYGLL